MKYTFQILTTQGMIQGDVESEIDFNNAPFGYVPYRAICSCECSQEVIDGFWNSVDMVLQQNNLTSSEYVRAIRAITENHICGESF